MITTERAEQIAATLGQFAHTNWKMALVVNLLVGIHRMGLSVEQLATRSTHPQQVVWLRAELITRVPNILLGGTLSPAQGIETRPDTLTPDEICTLIGFLLEEMLRQGFAPEEVVDYLHQTR